MDAEKYLSEYGFFTEDGETGDEVFITYFDHATVFDKLGQLLKESKVTEDEVYHIKGITSILGENLVVCERCHKAFPNVAYYPGRAMYTVLNDDIICENCITLDDILKNPYTEFPYRAFKKFENLFRKIDSFTVGVDFRYTESKLKKSLAEMEASNIHYWYTVMYHVFCQDIFVYVLKGDNHE